MMQRTQTIQFYKYQGTGNDFIILDNRDNLVPELSVEEIQKMCHRRFGIGADGFIMLKHKEGYDFEMDFYNSDGHPGSMCGNGGRCIVAFAHDMGIINGKTKFWAPDGEHEAEFNSHEHIALKMQDLNQICQFDLGLFADTGSPHLIINRSSNANNPTKQEAEQIRHHADFAPGGTNVNYIWEQENHLKIMTFERGVEDFTYSCGTGTVAAALSTNFRKNWPSPIKVITDGGNLSVRFKEIEQGKYSDIWLEGPAIRTFSGEYTLS